MEMRSVVVIREGILGGKGELVRHGNGEEEKTVGRIMRVGS